MLLTTPLSAREIVLQKAQVIRRLLFVVATPIFTLDLIQLACASGSPYDGFGLDHLDLWFLLNSVLSLALYLPLVSWLSLWIGLRSRTRFRAIITALCLIVIWCVVPLFAAEWAANAWRRAYSNYSEYSPFSWLYLLSPLSTPISYHIGELKILQLPAGYTLLINYTFYGTLLWLIRRRCISRADFYLRR